MSIKSDYLMDMVMRFCEAVLRAQDARKAGDADQALEEYEDVVGTALDMPADCALALSGPSLLSMVQLSAVDETLVVYCVYALMRVADIYEGPRPDLAALRREQAGALAQGFGFAADVTPREVEEALAVRAGN